MSLLKRVTPIAAPRELILGYGPPAAGKTRLFTSLSERFGRIAYIALDEGSESLDSVLPQYRERITVFQPSFKDPVIDSAAIQLTDWKSPTPPKWYDKESGEWTGYDTLILDTFSNLSKLWLWHVTQMGLFQDKRKMIGAPGQEGSVSLPDKGHYGGVHGIIRNFTTTIFRNNPTMNLIFICHETTDRDDETGRVLLGGPDTVGKAMLKEFPSNFKTIIRVTSEQGKAVVKNGKTTKPNQFIARMTQHGAYIARRNEANPKGNQLSRVVLDVDPANFWKQYDETSPLLENGKANGDS